MPTNTNDVSSELLLIASLFINKILSLSSQRRGRGKHCKPVVCRPPPPRKPWDILLYDCLPLLDHNIVFITNNIIFSLHCRGKLLVTDLPQVKHSFSVLQYYWSVQVLCQHVFHNFEPPSPPCVSAVSTDKDPPPTPLP